MYATHLMPREPPSPGGLSLKATGSSLCGAKLCTLRVKKLRSWPLRPRVLAPPMGLAPRAPRWIPVRPFQGSGMMLSLLDLCIVADGVEPTARLIRCEGSLRSARGARWFRRLLLISECSFVAWNGGSTRGMARRSSCRRIAKITVPPRLAWCIRVLPPRACLVHPRAPPRV